MSHLFKLNINICLFAFSYNLQLNNIFFISCKKYLIIDWISFQNYQYYVFCWLLLVLLLYSVYAIYPTAIYVFTQKFNENFASINQFKFVYLRGRSNRNGNSSCSSSSMRCGNKLMYVRVYVCVFNVCSHQHICAWFTFKMLIEFSGANINIWTIPEVMWYYEIIVVILNVPVNSLMYPQKLA